MQPITLRIQKDCALGETLQAEVHVDPRDMRVADRAFNEIANLLDRRLIALNSRVVEAMQLEVKYGPETAMRVRGVIEVLLGQKSLAEWERAAAQKDQAPVTPEMEERRAALEGGEVAAPGLEVIKGGKA